MEKKCLKISLGHRQRDKLFELIYWITYICMRSCRVKSRRSRSPKCNDMYTAETGFLQWFIIHQILNNRESSRGFRYLKRVRNRRSILINRSRSRQVGRLFGDDGRGSQVSVVPLGLHPRRLADPPQDVSSTQVADSSRSSEGRSTMRGLPGARGKRRRREGCSFACILSGYDGDGADVPRSFDNSFDTRDVFVRPQTRSRWPIIIPRSSERFFVCDGSTIFQVSKANRRDEGYVYSLDTYVYPYQSLRDVHNWCI